MNRVFATTAATLLLVPSLAFGQGDFTFRAAIDRTEVLLGDEVTLTITINHPEGHEYRLPEAPDVGKFRLLDRKEKRETAAGRVTKTLSLALAGYEIGELTIPPIPVLSPSGDTGFKTDELKVRIVGQLKEGEKGQDLRDVAPPVKLYVRTWIPIYALGAIGVAAAIWFLVRRWLRRRREAAEARRRALADAERLKPPHEVARDKLAQLLSEDLLKKGLHRLFYFRVSEIIREYVGARFAFDSLELTTTELIDALKARCTTGLDLDAFTQFSTHADLVKFAKHVPSDADVSRTVDEAFAFIDATTPREPAAHGT